MSETPEEKDKRIEIWMRLWWDDSKHKNWMDHNFYRKRAEQVVYDMERRAKPNRQW